MQFILVLTALIILISTPIECRICKDGSTWTYDTSHTGMRPDCPVSVIANHAGGYWWHSVERAKSACEAEPTCNLFQRYGGWGTCDTCYGHNYAHSCPDLNNITWIPETRWGHGATTANNYQLDCIPGPTMEPTPQPTNEPTNFEEFPCICYETVLLDQISDGVGTICYEYEINANPDPPAGAGCGDLEYVVLGGGGRSDDRCGLIDLTTVIKSITSTISDISTLNDVSYDLAFQGDSARVKGIKIAGISGGDSFTICFDETQVWGTMTGGRISYRQNGIETKCQADHLLPDLCPQWRRSDGFIENN